MNAHNVRMGRSQARQEADTFRLAAVILGYDEVNLGGVQRLASFPDRASDNGAVAVAVRQHLKCRRPVGRRACDDKYSGCVHHINCVSILHTLLAEDDASFNGFAR